MNQSLIAMLLQALHQPPHLSRRQAQQPSRFF
jgi:hypothetical protein